ncbi:hypothetical protein LDENG_00028570 [Lucifuga dentata]|nr:hypothetical protein LDENG_00028570 [Lucifuga dentata]
MNLLHLDARRKNFQGPHLRAMRSLFFKGPYHPFCMFEPNIFNFHTCNVTDNHFPKHTTGTLN